MDASLDLDLVEVGGFFLRRQDEHFVALGGALGQYQQKVRSAAYRYVERWTTAIDVGGHVGIFSRDFASRFETVHAFEPMPYNRACLERNAAPNTVIHPCGLGDRPGVAEMRYVWKNSGGSEVVDPDHIAGASSAPVAAEGKRILAEIRTLDSFGIENVGLIKIDVQGMEEHVLKGARETLLRWQPVVILEEKVVKTRPQDTRAIEAAAAVIRSLGYERAETVGQDSIYVVAKGAQPRTLD
ncbi:MAG: FkbM family methyltransferase [Rubrivivax sp.]|nr:FkbM family methyltransferase [Rubrivivax sp.]